ncbi:MAG: cytochrome c [Dokdonella sp.]
MKAAQFTSGTVLLHGALAVACVFAPALTFAQSPAVESKSLLLSRDELASASGEQIYQHICQGCHMPDGKGAIGAGHYPALAGDVNLASSRFAATVVLHGRNDMPAFAVGHPMGSFGPLGQFELSDVQIADVINYVRTHFGNHYQDAISADDVSALHSEEKKESP